MHNALGYGFAEKVYENTLTIELKKQGLRVEQQMPVKVYCEGAVVGNYVADLVVDNLVIVEIKAARRLTSEDEAQLLNYLRATEIEVGLLLNFGRRVEVKRLAFSNNYKKPGGP